VICPIASRILRYPIETVLADNASFEALHWPINRAASRETTTDQACRSST